jgi:predicted amidohydrolase
MTRIALYQARTGIDPEANASDLVAAVGEAAAGGAAMLFTPEMSGLLDRDRRARRRNLRSCRRKTRSSPPSARPLRRRASGSISARSPCSGADGKLANRAFVIDDKGEIRATYDKLHLFDVDLATGESWRESAAYAPGEGAVVVDTPAGPLGLSICYDLRFPPSSTALTDAGANCSPSPPPSPSRPARRTGTS